MTTAYRLVLFALVFQIGIGNQLLAASSGSAGSLRSRCEAEFTWLKEQGFGPGMMLEATPGAVAGVVGRRVMSQLIAQHKKTVAEIEAARARIKSGELGADEPEWKKAQARLLLQALKVTKRVALFARAFSTALVADSVVQDTLASFPDRPQPPQVSTGQAIAEGLQTTWMQLRQGFGSIAFPIMIRGQFPQREIMDDEAKRKKARDIVRADFLRNWSMVTIFQVMGNLISNGVSVAFLSESWVYGNTGLMMATEKETAARNTDFSALTSEAPEARPEIRTIDDALAHIPQFMSGDQGYVVDSRRKLVGFLTLMPLQMIVSYGIQTVANMAGHLSVNLPPEVWLNQLDNSLHLVTGFSIYLALKWSLIETWFFLNLMPAMHGTQEKDFLRALYENLNTQGQEGLPTSFDQFEQQIETLKLQWSQTNGDESLYEALGRKATNAGRMLASIFKSPTEEKLKQVLNVTNIGELVAGINNDQLTALYNENRANFIQELMIRFGIGMFDALVVFALIN